MHGLLYHVKIKVDVEYIVYNYKVFTLGKCFLQIHRYLESNSSLFF